MHTWSPSFQLKYILVFKLFHYLMTYSGTSYVRRVQTQGRILKSHEDGLREKVNQQNQKVEQLHTKDFSVVTVFAGVPPPSTKRLAEWQEKQGKIISFEQKGEKSEEHLWLAPVQSPTETCFIRFRILSCWEQHGKKEKWNFRRHKYA